MIVWLDYIRKNLQDHLERLNMVYIIAVTLEGLLLAGPGFVEK
jgi:hypothetical protein